MAGMIMVGEIVDPGLLQAGIFGSGETVEIGYEDPDTGEPTTEESLKVWVQAFGTWNPVVWDCLNIDQVQITGFEANWRIAKQSKCRAKQSA